MVGQLLPSAKIDSQFLLPVAHPLSALPFWEIPQPHKSSVTFQSKQSRKNTEGFFPAAIIAKQWYRVLIRVVMVKVGK